MPDKCVSLLQEKCAERSRFNKRCKTEVKWADPNSDDIQHFHRSLLELV